MTQIIEENRSACDVERDELLERAMARHHHSGDSLIEVLHAAQQLYGYLSPALLSRVAHSLKLPPSRVLGVATFYHLFRFAPREKHCAVICLGTACYEAGASDLLAQAHRAQHHSADQDWTIESGRCVGSCGLAPVVVIDGEPKARISRSGLESFLKA